MQNISLVVITKNEERNIARCLASVPFAAEKIVVDSHSADATQKIAESHGAKVFLKEFKGYREQKAFACAQATNEWILILDADEALSPQLAIELQNLLKQNLKSDAFDIPRRTFHLGKWIRYGGWHPDYQRRFFNKKNVSWQSQELHEGLTAKKVERLQHPILHWGFVDLKHQIETNNRYSTMGALELKRQGILFSLLKLVFKPWGKFIECYFFKFGIFDGLAGFIIAVGAAYSMFLKWAKLWELNKINSDSKRDSE